MKKAQWVSKMENGGNLLPRKMEGICSPQKRSTGGQKEGMEPTEPPGELAWVLHDQHVCCYRSGAEDSQLGSDWFWFLLDMGSGPSVCSSVYGSS